MNREEIQPLAKLAANRKVVLYLFIALLAQILFWHFSMPGPQLDPDHQPELSRAAGSCLISVLVLLLIPAAIVVVCRDSLVALGLSRGDVKFGVCAVLIVSPVLALGTIIGSGDLDMQRFYPLPGTSVGFAPSDYLLWVICYGSFYFSFEFFYRGFLLRAPSHLGLANCFVLSVFCCVMIHFGKPLAETLASIPASLLFAWIALRTRSIFYVFAIHLIVGITNDLAILWQRDSLRFWG